MNSKKRNLVINILGGLLGLVLGYFYPIFFQENLPLLAIGSAIFYFVASNSVNKNPDKEKVTDFSEYTWYTMTRFLYGFLAGGALTSTVILVNDILQQQKQFSGFILILSKFI